MSDWAEVKITATRPDARDAQVFINGVDWTPHLRSLKLEMGVKNISSITLELEAAKVEVDATVASKITAQVLDAMGVEVVESEEPPDDDV